MSKIRRAGIAIAALALGAGCGSVREQEPELPFHSGERLRARVRGDHEGAVAFQGWYDRVLDMSCAFRTASDGILRCLPIPAPLDISIAYADARCETAPLRLLYPGQLLRYVEGPAGNNECGAFVEPGALHVLGEEVELPAEVFIRRPTGECDPLGTNARVFSLGDEADPSEFVAGEMKHEPSRLAGLEVRKIEAEDGAWNIHAVHSTEFGSDCSPVRTKDGTVCVPREKTDEFDGHTFGDASCELPAATSQLSASLGKCGWDPEFLLSPLTIERCPDAPRTVHAVGSAADAFGASDTGCVPDNRSDFETRLVGDALPASRFIAFEEQRVGRGKLRELYLSDGDRPLLYGEKFFDAATGQQCDSYGYFCDGTTRCVPDSSGSTYSDPACTKLVLTQGPPDPCRPADPPRRTARRASEEGGCLEYFEVGARVLPGATYFATSDGCLEASFPEDTRYYELRPIPISEASIVETYIE